MDQNYQNLLSTVKTTLRAARAKAIRQLSSTIIDAYWEVGKHISESQKQHGWGKSIVEKLSLDLRKEFPGVEGYSSRNLWDMRRVYLTYYEYSNLRHVVAEIPWGHHLVILNKANTHEERLYYMDCIMKMAWGRDVLLNQIKAKAYERHLLQPKFNNFDKTLPEHLAEQANEVLKSSYSLEFLGINQPILEAELEGKLLQQLKELLLELGYGFAFVGSQVPLKLGEKTYSIDLLFFHRVLRCLIAIDLKTGYFKPQYTGTMNFHLELLDEQVRIEGENPSIGIILCAEKDNLEVEYALRSSNKPIGVVEYLLYPELPQNLIGLLPSPQELKSRFEGIQKNKK